MRLKYQMRGLGIGVIVTAILMGVSTGHGIPLTDAEIRARASELGMVDSNSLKLTDVEAVSTPKPDGKQEGSSEPEGDGVLPRSDGGEPEGDGVLSGSDGGEPEGDGILSGSDGSEPEGDGVLSGSDGGEPEGDGVLSGSDGSGDGEDGMGTQKSDSAGTEDGDVPAFASPKEGMITVEIEEGMDSYTISVILEEAGLIEKAYDFDQYLCNNLYSRKIVNGTYHIPAGISQEELAKIITREK